MKSLPLLLLLGALVFTLGAAPLSGQALDSNTGQTFQTDPTLAVPTLPIDIDPTTAPDDPGTAGSNTILIVGVVILGLILLVLLILAISRSSQTRE